MVERLFLTVPRDCLQFVIVVFPDHTHLLFLKSTCLTIYHEREDEIKKIPRITDLHHKACRVMTNGDHV